MFGVQFFPDNRKQRATRVRATFSRQDRHADRARLLFSPIIQLQSSRSDCSCSCSWLSRRSGRCRGQCECAPVETPGSIQFRFLAGIRLWSVSNHLEHVQRFAWAVSLILFGIGRNHPAVAWRAAIQLDYMLFAKIDLFFSVATGVHRFFKEFAKLSPELWQIN